LKMSFVPGYFTKAHNAPLRLVDAEKRCSQRFDFMYSRFDPIENSKPAAVFEGDCLVARLYYPGVLLVKILRAPSSTQTMMEDVSRVMILGGWVGMYSIIIDLTDPPASLDVNVMKDLVPFIRERRMWSRVQLQSMCFVLSSRSPGFSGLATSVLKTVFNFMHLPSAPLTIVCGKKLYEGENYHKVDARAMSSAVCMALSSPLNGYRVPMLYFPRPDTAPQMRLNRKNPLLLPSDLESSSEAGSERPAFDLTLDLTFEPIRLLSSCIIAYLGTKLFPVPQPAGM
jgi:hypothetical protein